MNLNNKIKFFLEELLYKIFKKIKYKIFINSELSGDRDIEWSFVAANIGSGPGRALDFGCGESYLGLIAAQAGYEVISLDLGRVVRPYFHPKLQFRQRDILNIDFPEESFALIINCSSIEHVGLAGRYGVKENRSDGDIEIMAKMRLILKLGGRMLLTIPVGKDAIFPPLHRVYGKERLSKLLENFVIEKEEYWVKNNQNKWIQVEESIALSKDSNQNLYGLGCFVLRPKN